MCKLDTRLGKLESACTERRDVKELTDAELLRIACRPGPVRELTDEELATIAAGGKQEGMK
jgi:hypothetical protein